MGDKIQLSPADNFRPLKAAYLFSANLKERLDIMKSRNMREQIIQVHRMIDHYLTEYIRAVKGSDTVSAVIAFHELLDQEISKMLSDSKPVSCKRGCSFCCLYNVDMCIDEAVLMLVYAEEKKIEIDWDKVKRQAEFKNSDKWITQTFAERRCVFSSASGECRIYEHRPGSCRMYHVLTPADLCDPEKYPNGKVQRPGNVYIETIDAGMQNASTENGNMPVMLLAAKQKIESKK